MVSNLTTVNIIQKIDKNAVESTKLAIFQNAAEKAKAKAVHNYNNEAYTSTMRTEVMNQARQSTSAPSLNFFKAEVSAANKASISTKENPYQSQQNQQQKSNIDKSKQPLYVRQEQMSKDVNIAAMHESVMIQAREQMAMRSDFQSNLKFLNSKAAVETLKNRPLL